MSSSPETRPSGLEDTGSLQTACLGGRWVMSQTPGAGIHLGLPGFENRGGRELVPCLSFSRNGFPQGLIAVAIENGNTLTLSRPLNPFVPRQDCLQEEGPVGQLTRLWTVYPQSSLPEDKWTLQSSSWTLRPLPDECIGKETAAQGHCLSKCLINACVLLAL